MLELATIVREVGEQYRRCFADRMLPSHLRALRDIEHCRTAVLGGQLYRCDGCAREQYGYHSCQNRACPKCQSERTAQWLKAQQQRLLPCEHFLFTFTLPATLRPMARSHQRLLYDAMLRCAADAILTLAADPRHLGARPAILAVLHTHGRDLGYHPHAHLLVSAGGLRSPDAETFIPSKNARFMMPARVLSVLFRQKIRHALERAELTDNLPDALWRKPWVVHAQHAGNGQQVLHYLGRYLFKSPLPNSRLERFENANVTFGFQSHRTKKTVHQTLPAHVFLAAHPATRPARALAPRPRLRPACTHLQEAAAACSAAAFAACSERREQRAHARASYYRDPPTPLSFLLRRPHVAHRPPHPRANHRARRAARTREVSAMIVLLRSLLCLLVRALLRDPQRCVPSMLGPQKSPFILARQRPEKPHQTFIRAQQPHPWPPSSPLWPTPRAPRSL